MTRKDAKAVVYALQTVPPKLSLCPRKSMEKATTSFPLNILKNVSVAQTAPLYVLMQLLLFIVLKSKN